MTAGIVGGLFYMFSYILINRLLVCSQQLIFFIVFIEANVLWALSEHKSWQQSAIREEKENKQLCDSAELGSNPPVRTLCAKFKAEEEWKFWADNESQWHVYACKDKNPTVCKSPSE